LDLTTCVGAFRYCTEKLMALYPNAKIVWCNVLQAAGKNIASCKKIADIYATLTSYNSCYNIDTNRCGINAFHEANAHVYLKDGLHPNVDGGWKIAKYDATAISNIYNSQFYDEVEIE
jgi:hypothetical protein